MITLVQRRKTILRKKKVFKLPKIRFFFKLNPKVVKILVVVTFFVALLFSVVYVFQKTLFAPQNIIKVVNYTKSSVNQFDDPYLYKKISTLIKWQNYYTTNYIDKRKIFKEIFDEFPIIQDFEITYTNNNTVTVKVLFNKPDLVIKSQDIKFGLYKWYTFRIYSGNTIGSWVQRIFFPDYLSWIDSIDWIFYDLPFADFITQMYTIIQNFPWNQRVIYLPGGQRTVVELSGDKRVYINNAKDFEIQFKNYLLLQKYYTNFTKLKQIDLWSLETDKVIVSG